MSHRRLYIAAYDIADPGRLRRALKIAKEFSTGGQKSVFECYLTRAERDELMRRMGATIKVDEDRFTLISIELRTRPRSLGIAVPPSDPEYFYVG